MPVAWGLAARQRRAMRMRERLEARGYRVIEYEDGGLLGNAFLHVECGARAPIDVYGILERGLVTLVFAAMLYLGYRWWYPS